MKRFLTYPEKKKVEELLTRRIEVIEPGLCRYVDDASDASVAGEARMASIDGCTPANVAKVRIDVFGALKKKTEVESIEMLTQQLELVKEQLRKTDSELMLVMDYLTRTAGVNWSMEQYTIDTKRAVQTAVNGSPA